MGCPFGVRQGRSLASRRGGLPRGNRRRCVTPITETNRLTAGGGLWRAGPIPLYFLSYVVLGFGFSILGPSLPTLRETTGATDGEIAILFPALSAGGFCGAFLVGRLYDRGLGHRLFGLGLAGFGIAAAAVALPSSVLVLVFVTFTLGLMGSTIDVGGNTLLLWHGGRGVARNMNLLHLMFGLGAFAAPLLVSWSTSSTEGLAAGLLPALVVGVVVGSTLFFGPTAPTAAVHEDGGGGPVPNAVQLAVVAFFFYVYVGAEVGFGGWVYTYADGNGSGSYAAIVTAGFWGAFTLCRLAVAIIGDRATPAHILFTSVSVAAAGAALLLLASHDGPLVVVGVAMIGAGVAPQFPTMLLFAERRVLLTGQSMSMFLAAAGLGGASIPWLMGQIIDRQGTDSLPSLGLGAMIATAACTVLVARALPPPRAFGV